MNSAEISACGRYRYRLTREVAPAGATVAFFGVNPSTADATVDDATVRKWKGFALRWGARKFIVGNVFAWRATDVRDIALDPAPAWSLHNRWHLAEIAREADILVPCWGSAAKLPAEYRHLLDNTLWFLRQTGKPMFHLGLTADGQPRHPLMLGYDTPLHPF